MRLRSSPTMSPTFLAATGVGASRARSSTGRADRFRAASSCARQRVSDATGPSRTKRGLSSSRGCPCVCGVSVSTRPPGSRPGRIRETNRSAWFAPRSARSQGGSAGSGRARKRGSPRTRANPCASRTMARSGSTTSNLDRGPCPRGPSSAARRWRTSTWPQANIVRASVSSFPGYGPGSACRSLTPTARRPVRPWSRSRRVSSPPRPPRLETGSGSPRVPVDPATRSPLSAPCWPDCFLRTVERRSRRTRPGAPSFPRRRNRGVAST